MNKTDQKIAEGIKTGNTEIIKAFYKRNFIHIKRHVLLNSGNEADAEDVFQDALVSIYQKLCIDILIINTSIHSYFYGVCKNLWKNRLRRKKKIVFDTTRIHQYGEKNATIIDEIEGKEREHLYRKYFMKLDTSNKTVLYHFFEGKSMREIAIINGYTEGYARKKKFDAKKQLLELITKDPVYNELITGSIADKMLKTKVQQKKRHIMSNIF